MSMSLQKLERMRDMMTERIQERQDREFVEQHGSELKVVREQAGFSQNEVAEFCEAKISNICTVEGGKHYGVGRGTLRMILDTYEMMKEIVDGDERVIAARAQSGAEDEPRP